MNVFIYWNLHRKCWSIRHKGKVIAHASYVMLKDVEYRVNENGRQRVVANRKKEVHAGVHGTLEHYLDMEDVGQGPVKAQETVYTKLLLDMNNSGPKQIGYNPYKGPHFFNRATGEAIHTGIATFMCPNAKVFGY